MKMFSIKKQFNFVAGHILYGLPEDHKCGRKHGHNYIVEVELGCSGLNRVGFIRDYGELDDLKRFLDEEWDHRWLNDVVPINDRISANNTTAEYLAYFLFLWCQVRWPETTAVRVSETPKTWAEYRP